MHTTSPDPHQPENIASTGPFCMLDSVLSALMTHSITFFITTLENVNYNQFYFKLRKLKLRKIKWLVYKSHC